MKGLRENKLNQRDLKYINAAPQPSKPINIIKTKMNNVRERTIIGQKKFLANYEARNAFIHLIQKMTLTLHLEI